MSLDAAFIKGMSKHEFKFAALWDDAKGPSLAREFRFHPERKWRFDFITAAEHRQKIAIELEGGTWRAGGKSSHTGLNAERDGEKFLEAALMGWIVFRLNGKQINAPTVKRIIDFVNGFARGNP
jgi:hypothetical protein